MKNDQKTSLVLFIISMIIFGTIGIFRRFIPLPSGLLAFARGIIGALFLILFAKIRRRKIRHGIGLKNAVWLVISGFAIGFNWMLLFEAYNYTTVAVATLCYYMQPVIVILLSSILLREHLTIKKIICAVVAVLGMVLVSGVTGAGEHGSGSFKGILYGLCAAALYASVIIMNKKIKDVDAYEKTIIQLLSAAFVMIPYILMTQKITDVRIDLKTILLVLLVGIVHTGIAYVLYFGSMEGMRAQSIAILSYIDPVTALILSAVILKEPMTPVNIIGAVLILGAAVISELRIERKADN